MSSLDQLENLVHTLYGRVLQLERRAGSGTDDACTSTTGADSFDRGTFRAEIEALKAENATLKTEIDSLRTSFEDIRATLRPATATAVPKTEKHFQAILSEKLGAAHMYIAVGITDITTDDAHIEIKRWGRYQEVPGQLAKYHQAVPRPRRCVYFFGDEPGPERYGQILELMKDAGIEVFSVNSQGEVTPREIINPIGTTEGLFRIFASQYIVERPKQERSGLQRTDLADAFRQWVLGRNTSFVVPENKELYILFDRCFGTFYDNQWYGKKLRGWKHRALVSATTAESTVS